jgi:hypothetical protein
MPLRGLLNGAAIRARNSTVFARSSSSDSCFIAGSKSLIVATTGHSRLMIRSFEVPKTFVNTLSIKTKLSVYQCKWQRRKQAKRRNDSNKKKRKNRNQRPRITGVSVQRQQQRQRDSHCDCRNQNPSPPLPILNHADLPLQLSVPASTFPWKWIEHADRWLE